MSLGQDQTCLLAQPPALCLQARLAGQLFLNTTSQGQSQGQVTAAVGPALRTGGLGLEGGLAAGPPSLQFRLGGGVTSVSLTSAWTDQQTTRAVLVSRIKLVF